MRLTRRLSLKTRLAALTGASTIVVLSIGAVLLYRNLDHEISAAITAELRVRATDVAAVYAESRDDAASSSPVVAQVIDQAGVVQAPIGQTSLLTPAQLAAAFSNEIVIDEPVDTIGVQARVVARPADTRRGRVVVVAATSTQPLAAARSRLLLILLIAGPSFAVAVTALAWLLAEASLRPVRRMTTQAASITLAEPGRRLPQPDGRDEIAELGVTLNEMLARIENTVARERMFIDDASHELRTPLAVLRGELELAADRPDEVEEVRAALASALEETDRLAQLAEDLLTLARADAGQLRGADEHLELRTIIQQVIDRLPVTNHMHITVTGPPVTVRGDLRSVEQVITNAAANALRHAHAAVTITVGLQDTKAIMTVADDGPGFEPDLLDHVFERFTRADTSRGRGGTGLGLAIVASLTHALGGTVTASNGPPLGGAVVTVKWPGVRAES